MTGDVTALVADYLTLRHDLGYHSPGQDRYLRGFAGWLDQAGHKGPSPLTVSLEWAAATVSAGPVQPGPPVDHGAWVPAAPGRDRRRHRGAATRAARPGRSPQTSAHLLRRRARRTAAGRRWADPLWWASIMLLCHTFRPACVHGPAHLRGPGVDLRRRGPHRRCAHRAGRQTRSDPTGAAARDRDRAAAGLRRPAASNTPARHRGTRRSSAPTAPNRSVTERRCTRSIG